MTRLDRLQAALPTCSQCGHWRRDDEQPDVGQCKRMPPMVVADSDGSPYSVWPFVDETELACGEFKPGN